MSTVLLTRWLIVCLVVLLIAYDLVMIFNKTPGDTLSEVVWDWTSRHPLIPLLIGLTLGHWFWRR